MQVISHIGEILDLNAELLSFGFEKLLDTNSVLRMQETPGARGLRRFKCQMKGLIASKRSLELSAAVSTNSAVSDARISALQIFPFEMFEEIGLLHEREATFLRP